MKKKQKAYILFIQNKLILFQVFLFEIYYNNYHRIQGEFILDIFYPNTSVKTYTELICYSRMIKH